RKLRRNAESGGFADVMLVFHPETLRPHERLVVEACWHQAAEHPRHGHHVAVDAWPAIDARRREALIELHFGGPRIGDRACAGFQLDERIGLFDAAGDEAARAVILTASRDDSDTVRQQRRRERISRVAHVALAVEREGERPAAVDAPALAQSVHGCHTVLPGADSPGL